MLGKELQEEMSFWREGPVQTEETACSSTLKDSCNNDKTKVIQFIIAWLI